MNSEIVYEPLRQFVGMKGETKGLGSGQAVYNKT